MKSNSERPRQDRAEQDMLSDANRIIIEAYLSAYEPHNGISPGLVVLTTDDIIEALGSMADISQADVNHVMVVLGFEPGYNAAGSYGWLMRMRDS